ncbi:hypothetical protein Ciccas_003277 [Cichlidogyrus casuarinus]|uniref:G-protein coupled receptors family 1 profile domain-containing protein n=1 Tax=Cichlidogyrus casuarinus TaxID=1844966 RepID=A0ABD2QET9_9PLAT
MPMYDNKTAPYAASDSTGQELSGFLLLFLVAFPINVLIFVCFCLGRLLAYITQTSILWQDPFYPTSQSHLHKSAHAMESSFGNRDRPNLSFHSSDDADHPVRKKTAKRNRLNSGLRFRKAAPLRPSHVYVMHMCLVNSALTLTFFCSFFLQLVSANYRTLFCADIDPWLSYLIGVKFTIRCFLNFELLNLKNKVNPFRCCPLFRADCENDQTLSSELRLYSKARYYSYSPDLYFKGLSSIYREISHSDVLNEMFATIKVILVYALIWLLYFLPRLISPITPSFYSILSLHGCRLHPDNGTIVHESTSQERNWILGIVVLHVLELICILAIYLRLELLFQQLIDKVRLDTKEFNLHHHAELLKVRLAIRVQAFILILIWIPISISRALSVLAIEVSDTLRYAIFVLNQLQYAIDPLFFVLVIRSVREQIVHCATCRWGRDPQAIEIQSRRSTRKIKAENSKARPCGVNAQQSTKFRQVGFLVMQLISFQKDIQERNADAQSLSTIESSAFLDEPDRCSNVDSSIFEIKTCKRVFFTTQI